MGNCRRGCKVPGVRGGRHVYERGGRRRVVKQSQVINSEAKIGEEGLGRGCRMRVRAF